MPKSAKETFHGSMHSAISGEYAEALVRFELSRDGWEAFTCRGAGIDILAVDSSGKRRIGVSVKNRDRRDVEGSSTTVFGTRTGVTNKADEKVAKFEQVCKSLEAEPWIAVVTITDTFHYAHITSLRHFLNAFDRLKTKKAMVTKEWYVNQDALDVYIADPDVFGNKEPGKRGDWELKARSRVAEGSR
jgi:hypothetical protein